MVPCETFIIWVLEQGRGIIIMDSRIANPRPNGFAVNPARL